MPDSLAPVTNSRFDFPDGAWHTAILIAVIFGAIGGLAAEAQRFTDPRQASQSNTDQNASNTERVARNSFRGLFLDTIRHRQFSRIVMTAFVGSATAVCGLFIVLVSPVISGLGPGAFWAFLAAVSTTLGIASERVLPSIKSDVFKRLGVIENQLDSNISRIKDNAGLDATERALDDALSGAAIKSIIDHGLTTAKAYLEKNPRARRPTIRLARLHFEKLADKPGALDVLTRFITYLESHVDTEDKEYKKDLSDAYYNCACYYLTSPRADPESMNEHIPSAEESERGVADLKKSIDIYPKNVEDARTDRDFNWIKRNNPDIGDLLK